jgi:hypothetical protein
VVSRYKKEEERAVPKWQIMPKLNWDENKFKELIRNKELVEVMSRRGTKLYASESATVGRSVEDRGHAQTYVTICHRIFLLCI